MRRVLVATALTATVVLGLTACGSGSKSSGSSTSTTKAAPQAPVSLSGKVNNKGTKDISTKGSSTSVELETDDFYFNPTFIKVAPGQKIKVELKNEGSVPHTFTSPTLGVNQELQPDSNATVEVTVPASGNAEFYCRFHKDNGMQGVMFTTSS
ncbi:MAG: cupredoxin domain-containing protein [Acidimicrobiia bacterium]